MGKGLLVRVGAVVGAAALAVVTISVLPAAAQTRAAERGSTMHRSWSRSSRVTDHIRSASGSKRLDLANDAAIDHYLRSIGVDPARVLFETGVRNYAGPRCPGRGWSCASTSRPVVQIARRGGINRLVCSGRAPCVSVQVGGEGARNEATVDTTASFSQSVSITQSNTTGANAAIVIQLAAILSLNATVSQSISITQTNVSGSNTAKVSQTMLLAAAAISRGGITEALDGNQSIAISQDSVSGANTVEGLGGGGSNPLIQTQAIVEGAIGGGAISEEADASPEDTAPNMSINVEQNQNTPAASGANSSAFKQTSSLTLTAVTPSGPVSLTESSPSGGLQATVNQSSTGLSTSSPTQSETQMESASTTLGGSTLPPDTTETETGPVRCCSVQGSNPADTFTITQSSTQCAGTAVATCTTGSNPNSVQTEDIMGTCQTSGNCTVNQTVTVDGVTTTNTQSGMSVTTSTTCSGSTCTSGQAPEVSIGPVCVNGDTVALNGAVNWEGQTPGTTSIDWGDDSTPATSFPSAHTYESEDESPSFTITVTATNGADQSGQQTYEVTLGEQTCTYSFTPVPIAAQGSLEPGSSTPFVLQVTQNGEPLNGAPVWLTFSSSEEGGGSATADGTLLSGTPQVFVTSGSGEVPLSYMTPGESPNCDTDTVDGTDSPTAPDLTVSDYYDFSCIE
jgi:hypothetical protein